MARGLSEKENRLHRHVKLCKRSVEAYNSAESRRSHLTFGIYEYIYYLCCETMARSAI